MSLAIYRDDRLTADKSYFSNTFPVVGKKIEKIYVPVDRGFAFVNTGRILTSSLRAHLDTMLREAYTRLLTDPIRVGRHFKEVQKYLVENCGSDSFEAIFMSKKHVVRISNKHILLIENDDHAVIGTGMTSASSIMTLVHSCDDATVYRRASAICGTSSPDFDTVTRKSLRAFKPVPLPAEVETNDSSESK